ncbi:unnamed protein product [Larinioides sclopetarius]|uniref:Uncharacterized protein n=1 Tax=Larinioides sclopetarius TaxID=280406 RepID=A0AAV2AMX4_9ARAC
MPFETGSSGEKLIETFPGQDHGQDYSFHINNVCRWIFKVGKEFDFTTADDKTAAGSSGENLSRPPQVKIMTRTMVFT